MPIPLPGATVTVESAFLVLQAAGFTDKNPGLTLLDLDPKHYLVIRLAGSAGLVFMGGLLSTK
jgi:hypothetical protein